MRWNVAVWNKVVIVGVGLLGGSVGLALRQRALVQTLVGLDADPDRATVACRRGAIDEVAEDLTAASSNADLVVLATPVEPIPSLVGQVLDQPDFSGWITDVGSTKASLMQRLRDLGRERNDSVAELPFVGSHPLAGSEKSGPEHADGDLFVGKLTIVVQLDETPGKTQSAGAGRTSGAESGNAAMDAELSHASAARWCVQAEAFWQSLGSRTQRLPADLHDRGMASISHLPHLLASVLAATTPADDLPLAASGFRDSTRIAAGDVDLWLGILLDNRDFLLEAIDRLTGELNTVRDALKNRDEPRLRQTLLTGKKQRNALGN